MAQLLLIEPDRIVAGTLRQGFEMSGHAVVMCSSAQSAIYAADELRPDCIILELQLIGHSGVEFLYEFRSYPEWQSIPVIIYTQVPPAEFSGSWQLLSEQLGVVTYFYKPTTTFKELSRAVDLYLPVLTT